MRKTRPKPVWDPKLVLWELPDAAWVRIEPVLDYLLELLKGQLLMRNTVSS